MKMQPSYSLLRSILLIALAVVIFAAFGLQLMQIQLVDAPKYQAMVQGHSTSTQPIKAVRGEIVDRNGVPLVQNKMSYDVIFDLAFLPTGGTNRAILDLMDVFEANNAKWIDELPVSGGAPFAFLPGKEAEVAQLKDGKVQPYATAEDVMAHLVALYKLGDYPPETARKLAGVRYEMERRDFSLQTPYTFAADVDNNLLIQIKERSYQLDGVDVVTNGMRIYPSETIAPHLLGTVGPLYQEEYQLLRQEGQIFDPEKEPYDTKGYTMDDTIGKSGIEKALETQLRGKNGLREVQMDANGQVVSVSESISPVPGNTVVLTIDSEMQRNLQAYLEAQIQFLAENEPPGRGGEANAGAAVVVNVKTGEVLATATYPTYTLTEYREDYREVEQRENQPLINRATIGEYTPGSIYKPVVALAGLNTGTITPETQFFCGHIYTFFGPEYLPKCLGSHGNIGVHNALAWSCNIFFYETGRLTGIDAVDNMAMQLGLGEPTGVEIDEAKGQRSNPAIKLARSGEQWYGADTIQTAIGQLDSRFSPLQMANYAATIANRGQRMKLTMVKEVRSYTLGEIVEPFVPVVAYQMDTVTPEAFDSTINGMIGATIGSAGGTFGGYPITVASKTGTPQVTEEIVNSTYIAFAPAEDPEIAIAVVIEQGWQGYTGAPVAKAIFDDYFGITHRGAVASGPQQLKDQREKDNPTEGSSEYNQQGSDTPPPVGQQGTDPPAADGEMEESNVLNSLPQELPEVVEPPEEQPNIPTTAYEREKAGNSQAG